MQFRHFRCIQQQLAVNAQHTLYTADIDIPLIVYQPGVGQIFVLDSSVRLSEENELLFLYKPGEKQIIRTYPYFAPLVALHHVDFCKQVGRDVRLFLGNGVVVDKAEIASYPEIAVLVV